MRKERPLGSQVLCIAHRGGAALAPENTLAAFARAIALGADGAELDVHLTRDAKLVVCHDFRLNPDLCRDETGAWLTLPTPRIRDLMFCELARYDVGRARPESAYAREHPNLVPADGERIPLLADVIRLARHAAKAFRLFVEIKTSLADPALSAPPELLAQETANVLTQNNYLGQSVIIGFDWRALRLAKAVAPSVACWFSSRPQSWFEHGEPPPEDDPPPELARQMLRHWAQSGSSPWADGFDEIRYGGSIPAAIKAAGGDGWFPYWRDATADVIAEAHSLGLKVGAWTLDEPAEMQALASRGIDAICTDRPDVVKQAASRAYC